MAPKEKRKAFFSCGLFSCFTSTSKDVVEAIVVVERKYVKASQRRAESLDTSLARQGPQSAGMVSRAAIQAAKARLSLGAVRVQTGAVSIDAHTLGYLDRPREYLSEPPQLSTHSSRLLSSIAHERMRWGVVQAAAIGLPAQATLVPGVTVASVCQQDTQSRASHTRQQIAGAPVVDAGKTHSLVVNSRPELESVFGSMDPGTNRTASMGLCVHPSVGSLPEDALLTNSPNPSIVPNRSSPSSPCSPHVGPSLQIAVSSMKEVEEQITGLQYIGRGACGAVVKGTWNAGSEVAAKFMVSEQLDANSAYLEAIVSKILAHPNVLQTFDFKVMLLDEQVLTDVPATLVAERERPASACSRFTPTENEQGFFPWITPTTGHTSIPASVLPGLPLCLEPSSPMHVPLRLPTSNSLSDQHGQVPVYGSSWVSGSASQLMQMQAGTVVHEPVVQTLVIDLAPGDMGCMPSGVVEPPPHVGQLLLRRGNSDHAESSCAATAPPCTPTSPYVSALYAAQYVAAQGPGSVSVAEAEASLGTSMGVASMGASFGTGTGGAFNQRLASLGVFAPGTTAGDNSVSYSQQQSGTGGMMSAGPSLGHSSSNRNWSHLPQFNMGGGGNASIAGGTMQHSMGPMSLASQCSSDSFDTRAHGRLSEPGAVQCTPRQVLRQLGGAPSKYATVIIMEYADEGTLHAAIRRRTFRPTSERSAHWAMRALLRTAREVALGMAHLHNMNVIHGDLKPGNVLLKSSRGDSRGFVAKVADFGLSRITTDQLSVATNEWSTTAYMAPEYFDNKLMKASDVYSFGVMLWQMYTGKRPFEDHHQARVAVGVMMGDLALEWPPAAPVALVELATACCLHDPVARPTFRRVTEVLASIEAGVKDEHQRRKMYNGNDSSRSVPRSNFMRNSQGDGATPRAGLSSMSASSRPSVDFTNGHLYTNGMGCPSGWTAGSNGCWPHMRLGNQGGQGGRAGISDGDSSSTTPMTAGGTGNNSSLNLTCNTVGSSMRYAQLALQRSNSSKGRAPVVSPGSGLSGMHRAMDGNYGSIDSGSVSNGLGGLRGMTPVSMCSSSADASYQGSLQPFYPGFAQQFYHGPHQQAYHNLAQQAYHNSAQQAYSCSALQAYQSSALLPEHLMQAPACAMPNMTSPRAMQGQGHPESISDGRKSNGQEQTDTEGIWARISASAQGPQGIGKNKSMAECAAAEGFTTSQNRLQRFVSDGCSATGSISIPIIPGLGPCGPLGHVALVLGQDPSSEVLAQAHSTVPPAQISIASACLDPTMRLAFLAAGSSQESFVGPSSAIWPAGIAAAFPGSSSGSNLAADGMHRSQRSGSGASSSLAAGFTFGPSSPVAMLNASGTGANATGHTSLFKGQGMDRLSERSMPLPPSRGTEEIASLPILGLRPLAVDLRRHVSVPNPIRLPSAALDSLHLDEDGDSEVHHASSPATHYDSPSRATAGSDLPLYLRALPTLRPFVPGNYQAVPEHVSSAVQVADGIAAISFSPHQQAAPTPFQPVSPKHPVLAFPSASASVPITIESVAVDAVLHEPPKIALAVSAPGPVMPGTAPGLTGHAPGISTVSMLAGSLIRSISASSSATEVSLPVGREPTFTPVRVFPAASEPMIEALGEGSVELMAMGDCEGAGSGAELAAARMACSIAVSTQEDVEFFMCNGGAFGSTIGPHLGSRGTMGQLVGECATSRSLNGSHMGSSGSMSAANAGGRPNGSAFFIMGHLPHGSQSGSLVGAVQLSDTRTVRNLERLESMLPSARSLAFVNKQQSQ